jgi:hypothetical protein
MKEIDKIAFIEIQQGKILSTKSENQILYPWRESGESDEQTLIREMRN